VQQDGVISSEEDEEDASPGIVHSGLNDGSIPTLAKEMLEPIPQNKCCGAFFEFDVGDDDDVRIMTRNGRRSYSLKLTKKRKKKKRRKKKNQSERQARLEAARTGLEKKQKKKQGNKVLI
jgi:hypothetical protein